MVVLRWSLYTLEHAVMHLEAELQWRGGRHMYWVVGRVCT